MLQLPNYLEKDWSCKGEITANPPEFAVWSFESFDSAQKVVLDLGMHTSYKHGSIIMALYCPFWMLNKTGLMLSYRVRSTFSADNIFLACFRKLFSLKILETLNTQLFQIAFFSENTSNVIELFAILCANVCFPSFDLYSFFSYSSPSVFRNNLLIGAAILPGENPCIQHAPLFCRNQVRVAKSTRVRSR